MGTLRAELQRGLFQDDEERFLSYVDVTKENEKKKKKETYLCVTASIQQPVVVKLYLVRAKDDGYHKKESFMLRDIKVVDGINPRKPNSEFDIVFGDNRRRNFLAVSINGKEAFIKELFFISHKFLPIQKPEFVNIKIPDIESPKHINVQDDSAIQTIQDEDYHPITQKEEADFRRMLKQFNLQLFEAKEFNDKLTQMLADLDNTNIESIMASETAVADLINNLEKCDEHMKFLGDRLFAYDTVLHQVEENVEIIEEKANLGQVERENLRLLLNSLTEFSELMVTVSPEQLELLRRPKFGDAASINLCLEAAKRAHKFMSTETPHSHTDAYKEGMQTIRSAFGTFVDTFYSYISATIENMRDRVPLDESTIMPKHSAVYRQLNNFGEIVNVIRVSRPNVYQRLLDNYRQHTATIFHQDQQNFYQNHEMRVNMMPAHSKAELNEFGSLMEMVAAESEIVVQAEQSFLQKFFHIPSIDPTTQQLSDSMRSVIRTIFEPMADLFQKFGRACCSRNPHELPAALFVRLVSLLPKYNNPKAYFSTVFGNFVVAMKRILDEQMNHRLESYRNQRISKRQRIGLLSCIDEFSDLIKNMDAIFGNSERRSDFEKWAVKLCNGVIEGIDNAAMSPNSKSPASVVRLENFHKLHSVLSEMKVPALDEIRNQVKRKYQENMKIYIFDYLGKPLEKLHLFFESVEFAINSGVRPEEVGFQQQFSRGELKKAISAHQGREVKKGLENLYAKVEKHLNADSPLLQVVWRDMQQEFLSQIKHYQRLISQCYPNSRLNLEFTIEDVLNYFSQIAQQH
ncbi:unnamed protein product [Bursaphelenchus okinawaensis]|uniref:Exocyst complex component Sec3 PIP2-binding N-terminal domain-containing protein n=1 Tax=Bursaphelenchus okinawaensis TaxID=465554 RepID=A0A811JSE3_9BILA|nr:unnamed protein product [Bursaphelenchus okinawaensis]CAG9080782.1 unnamed protein product [Bursaphelenchus okinawaensis]